MDKLEIIDILLSTYIENPKNRAIEDGIPRYITRSGNRCPLGSVIIDDDLCNVFGGVFALVSHALSIKDVTSSMHLSFMPPQIVESYYEGHHLRFWEDLMKFHDDDNNFTETGLTFVGQYNLDYLKKVWGDKRLRDRR